MTEPHVAAELGRLAGKDLVMVVHLALTVDGQFFLVICTHQGLHDPRGIIRDLMTSDAFTQDRRASLETVAA
jgi:hypothetical protein